MSTAITFESLFGITSQKIFQKFANQPESCKTLLKDAYVYFVGMELLYIVNNKVEITEDTIEDNINWKPFEFEMK